MRPRSSALHAAALLLALGAVAASASGMIRVSIGTRPQSNGNGHQVKPRPAPIPVDPIIVVDGVRYRVVCTVTRTIGGQPNPDGSANVATTVQLTLRRADGRIYNTVLQPQLRILQDQQPTTIELIPQNTFARTRDAIWFGTGNNSWADDVQLTGQLTIPQRRGNPATVTIRSIPFTLTPLP
jgi:hypothetical protein